MDQLPHHLPPFSFLLLEFFCIKMKKKPCSALLFVPPRALSLCSHARVNIFLSATGIMVVGGGALLITMRRCQRGRTLFPHRLLHATSIANLRFICSPLSPCDLHRERREGGGAFISSSSPVPFMVGLNNFPTFQFPPF